MEGLVHDWLVLLQDIGMWKRKPVYVLATRLKKEKEEEERPGSYTPLEHISHDSRTPHEASSPFSTCVL